MESAIDIGLDTPSSGAELERQPERVMEQEAAELE